MDTDLAHGMSTLYQGGQHRHSYHEMPMNPSPYGSVPQQASHTLPPIQPQRQALAHPSNSYDHSPRHQNPQSSQAGLNTQYYAHSGVSQAPYSHNMQHYAQMPYPQPLGQDYASQPSGLPNIRPMPANSSLMAPQQYHVHQNGEEDYRRTHVVGSQGRRGILPSDEGRPAAPITTASGSNTVGAAPIPPKDVDGKFPCPHCHKTYLHAKHLKRHLLRHTGDRPYSCCLCHDTFSRSDILKRHFQKCSIRRGNPTGATHLSNSQSHLKKQQAKKTSTSSATTAETGFPTAPHTPTSLSFAENPQGMGVQHASTGSSASNLLVRSDDKHYEEGAGRDGRVMNGSAMYNRPTQGVPGQNGRHSMPSSGSSTPITSRVPGQIPQTYTPDSTHARMDSYSQGYSQPSNSSRHSMSQAQGSSQMDGSHFDWSALQASRDHAVNGQLPSPVQQDSSIRAEADSKIPFAGMEYELMGGGFSSRDSGTHPDGLNFSMPDTYHTKADQLTIFCQLDGLNAPSAADQILRSCISADNIEHYIQGYMNFDPHWPAVHLPTFDPSSTYDGLLLALICTGAVYSDRLSIHQVRSLMRKVQSVLEQSTDYYALSQASLNAAARSRRFDPLLYAEMKSLHLLASLGLWHGDNDQRQDAIRNLVCYVKTAKALGWFEPAPAGTPMYSVLHQPDLQSNQGVWDWSTWIAQEQRSRYAYTWWMVDAALTLYFNCPPSFDPLEMKLPMPADDAAWEAQTPHDCACALGLNGPGAQGFNLTGSRRIKQVEMHKALKVLMHPKQQIATRSTNAFGKFILVHGLVIQIYNAHSQLYSQFPLNHDLQHRTEDWIISAPNSGHSTPDMTSVALVSAISQALNKFKIMWDEDTALQYPAGTSRKGFCRDGIHFFYLSRMLLNGGPSPDWHSPWWKRFTQIFAALKRIRIWVASEAASIGEEIGSVGAMNDAYGTEEMTLNMKLLFAPLGKGY